MAVTSSKQWIHFFLSDLWPPTSNSLREWEKSVESQTYKQSQTDNKRVNVLPEVKIFKGEVGFNNASGLHSGP